MDLASASAAAAIGVATTVRDEEDCKDERLNYWTQDQNSSFLHQQPSKVSFLPSDKKTTKLPLSHF